MFCIVWVVFCGWVGFGSVVTMGSGDQWSRPFVLARGRIGKIDLGGMVIGLLVLCSGVDGWRLECR